MDGMQGGRRRGRRLRRKEEAWGDVAETRFVQPFDREILLVDERDEGARDQVPVFVQGERDHRLDDQLADRAAVVRAAALVTWCMRTTQFHPAVIGRQFTLPASPPK
jgi:hypothetical protein